MNTQFERNEKLRNNKSYDELVERIINEVKQIRLGDINYMKNFVNSVKSLKEEIMSSDKNEQVKGNIVRCCERILSEIFGYLNNNDKNVLDTIENQVVNIKNIMYGVVSYTPDNQINEELQKEAEELIKNRASNYDFSKLENLYVQLYNALTKNDKKEITALRGRIIRYLKKHDKKIDNVFENLKTLYFIQNILETTLTDDEKKLLISNLLTKEENKDYADYFKDSINNLNLFKKKYDYICMQLDYNKIVHYVENYKNELGRYGDELRKSYEASFLDKNLSLGNFSKVIPNATATAIKILANTVSEFKETDSKKKKMSKLKEAFADLGRILSIPVVVGGKVLKENWYTLYMLSKGIIGQNVASKKEEKEESLGNKSDNNAEEDEVIISQETTEMDTNMSDDTRGESNNLLGPKATAVRLDQKEVAVMLDRTEKTTDGDTRGISGSIVTESESPSVTKDASNLLRPKTTVVGLDQKEVAVMLDRTEKTMSLDVQESSENGAVDTNETELTVVNADSQEEELVTPEIDWDAEIDKIRETGGAYVPGVNGSIVNVKIEQLEDGGKMYIIDYDTNSRVELIKYPTGYIEGDYHKYYGGTRSYREYDSDNQLVYEINFGYRGNGDYIAEVVDIDGQILTYKRGANGIYINSNNPSVDFRWDASVGRMVSSDYVSATVSNFNGRYETLLTQSMLSDVSEYGENGVVMTFSNGTIVNVTPEEKIISYPNGEVYREVSHGESVDKTITYWRLGEPVTMTLDENGNETSMVKVESEDEGFNLFEGWRLVENPYYHTNSGYYSETVMQPPVFLLPGWLADIVEENNEHVFTERR